MYVRSTFYLFDRDYSMDTFIFIHETDCLVVMARRLRSDIRTSNSGVMDPIDPSSFPGAFVKVQWKNRLR